MKIYLNNFDDTEITKLVTGLKIELPSATFNESLTFREHGEKNNLGDIGGDGINQVFSLAHYFATIDISNLAYGVAGNAVWEGIKKVILTFKQSKVSKDRNSNGKTFAILVSQPFYTGNYYSLTFLIDESLSEDQLDFALSKIAKIKDKLDKSKGIVFPEGIEFTFDTNNERWQSHSKLVVSDKIYV